MLKLFILSTSEDIAYRDTFTRHLSSLRRSGKISIWSDGQILPGADWSKVTNDQLSQTDIVVLLISDDFMASDQIWDLALKESLNRRENGEALMLLPIFVRPCVVKNTVLESIQGLPRNQKAISLHSSQDEAWYHIAIEISRLVDDFPQIIAISAQSATKNTPANGLTSFGNKNIISGSVIFVGGNLSIGDT